MAWTGIPAGPGGPLAAARAVRQGPPTCYQLDGVVYELRPSWWPMLELLPRGGWHIPLVLDMTHPEDAGELRRRLTGRGNPDRLRSWDLEAIAEGLVEAATARPWWVAEKLCAFIVEHFGELDGRVSADLVDLIEYAPARCLNIVHMALVEGADTKERKKFDNELYRPPPKRAAAIKPSTWQLAAEGADFMATMAAMGGMGALSGAGTS